MKKNAAVPAFFGENVLASFARLCYDAVKSFRRCGMGRQSARPDIRFPPIMYCKGDGDHAKTF